MKTREHGEGARLSSRKSLRNDGDVQEKSLLKYTEKPLEPIRRPYEFKLSILIVNYNSGEMLLDCLESICATVKTDPFEVIVVDNDSKDSSIDSARDKYPEVRFIENSFNNWFTGGTNQAIEVSRGEYILCLNPDTVCRGNAIDELVSFLDSDPQAGLAAPRLLNGDGSLQPSCRNFLKSRYLILRHILPWKRLPDSWRKKAVLEYWDHDETIQPDWIIGACILVRRETVEDIGLKDEGFPMFHEETDWCYRMKKAGWGIWFVHTAEITHFGSQSAVKYWGSDLVLEFYKGKHRFVRKHFGPLSLLLHRLLLAGLLLLRLTVVLVRRVFSGNADLRQETVFLLKGMVIQLGLNGKNLPGIPHRKF
ncbi:MAG: glycosyltransferase [Candidatus Aegiribacteria sp.]|nr:glycosyltransferase [Candidatus Aegiribacteria sp.]